MKAWTGQLHHSRAAADDWGYIRDESGKLIIRVPVTGSEDEIAEHRRNKTDPTQPVVDAILSMLNAPAHGREAYPAAGCSQFDSTKGTR